MAGWKSARRENDGTADKATVDGAHRRNAQCAGVGQIQAGRWAEVGILTRVQMQLKACLVGQGVVQLRAPGRNAEVQACQLAVLGRGAARIAQLTQTRSVLRRARLAQDAVKKKEEKKKKRGRTAREARMGSRKEI